MAYYKTVPFFQPCHSKENLSQNRVLFYTEYIDISLNFLFQIYIGNRNERNLARRPLTTYIFGSLVPSFWLDSISNNHRQLCGHCGTYKKETTAQAYQLFPHLFGCCWYDSWNIFRSKFYLPIGLFLAGASFRPIDNFKYSKNRGCIMRLGLYFYSYNNCPGESLRHLFTSSSSNFDSKTLRSIYFYSVDPRWFTVKLILFPCIPFDST